MTKSYSILQAKLHELESILDDLLLHGPETQSHDTLSNEIKQKIAFMTKLLSAENQSHQSRPQHLKHISNRLATLEKTFHDRDTNRTLSSEELDKESTCSCTESYFNADGEALDETGLAVSEDPKEVFDENYVVGDKALVEFNGGEIEGEMETEKNKVGYDKLASFVYEDAEEFFEGVGGENELVEFKGQEQWKQVRPERNEFEGEEGRRESIFGKRCCAGACGFLSVMFLMGFIMVTFSGCFYLPLEEATSFAVPT